jgi:serine/threonine protein kinase
VLIKQTKTGNFTAKLIDFDNSYFSSKPPELSEEMVGDMVYYSPELALYIQDTKQVDYKLLTTQSDIFALGLLFSQYLTGKLPYFEQEKYQYACIAVNAGKSLDFTAENLPPTLVQLLHEMLAPKPTERPTITVIFDFLKQLDLKDYLTEKDFQRPASLLTGTMKEKNGKYDLPQQESGLKGKGLGILKGKK